MAPFYCKQTVAAHTETIITGPDVRALPRLFEEAFAESRTVAYRETRPSGRPASVYADDDQQDIVDKLRGLGYI